MTVTVVEPEDDAQGESEHEAAVSEGAAAVHQEGAESAADDAAVAAEAAQMAAQLALEATEQIASDAAAAGEAAHHADTAYSGVLTALSAQTSAITALIEELRAGREQATAQPEPEPISKTPDKAPAKKGHWYYGG